ncbi:NDMA-dependent alcohol dehydrogenase [Gordonia sp. TBRC 11910]|uniref:alcohol dehydrogenase n=1 Tax=Gordonia asplenii TaxID=2725283 RepID=A0A848L098_9ACTN|nr:NDMA-dependent alcohol dehydrogenase [Gordonia asplenii]NMO04344.1 NDMA-dependent alcohol dehydrogenase [Gordonia asplenii]
MKTRGAIITEVPGRLHVAELELAPPQQGEVLVKMVASGLCHSDLHYTTGDMEVGTIPMLCGHEGSGIIEEIGPDTQSDLEVGDHVIFSFITACGKCEFCARGMQNLCHLGALMLHGSTLEDVERYRFSMPDGTRCGQIAGLGTFAEHTVVSVGSCVKVDKELPLDVLCLLGCGVGTGWGSAVNSAEIEIGETVIIAGIGGVGINAVQGAVSAGATNIIAVDPVPFKLDEAKKIGATHTAESIEAAAEIAASLTNGQGADKAVITIGVVKGEHVAAAFNAIRKAGTVVVTGVASFADTDGIPVSLAELTLFQKRIQGSLFGGASPNYAIPRQVDLFRHGQLKLEELITHRYTLDEVQQGYDDMEAGKNLRGIVVF